jgi:hypothetical protein
MLVLKAQPFFWVYSLTVQPERIIEIFSSNLAWLCGFSQLYSAILMCSQGDGSCCWSHSLRINSKAQNVKAAEGRDTDQFLEICHTYNHTCIHTTHPIFLWTSGLPNNHKASDLWCCGSNFLICSWEMKTWCHYIYSKYCNYIFFLP